MLKDELYRAVFSELIRRLEQRMLPVLTESAVARAPKQSLGEPHVDQTETIAGRRAAR